MAKLTTIRFTRATLTAAVSSIAILIATPFANAQTSDQNTIAGATVNLSAGPLSRSILAISDAFGVDILVPNELVTGRTAPAIFGAKSAEDALNSALESSGLSFTMTDGAFVIKAQTARAEPSRPTTTSEPRVEPEEPMVADTIVVTGTKQDLSLQDTQTSVAVITANQIRDQVLIDAEDIFLRTVNVSTSGNGALRNVSIRGVSQGGVGGAGVGDTLNVYVDGAPNSASSNTGTANLWDVEQVEILRGPQSTIQGRNALAGAIIIKTADPEFSFGAEGRIRGGNKDQRQYSGMITGPIVTDQLAFRISADYREIDFGVANVSADDENSRFQEALDIRGKLLLEPQAIDGLRIELIGNYEETDFGDFNTVFAPGPVVSVTNNVPSSLPGAFSDFDIFGEETFGQSGASRLESIETLRAILDVQYVLKPNWTLNALGTYEDSERETLFSGAITRSFDETYQAELRANFDYGDIRGWIGGYMFSQEVPRQTILNTPLSDFFIPTLPVGGVVIAESEQTTETENYALFGDVTYEPNEKWEVNVGLRVDYEEFEDSGVVGVSRSEPDGCIVDPNLPFPFAGFPCESIIPVQNTDPEPPADFDAFLPRGSVTYNIDELRSVSFAVARGYRAGGAYVRNLIGQNNLIIGSETDSFDPEFVTNFELAFRSLWLDERLRVNANAFFADWTDQQVLIVGPSGIMDDFTIQNAGSSELYGVEVDIAYRMNEELDIFAGLGLQETEFTDFPFATVAPSGDPQFANLAGNEFNQAPNVTASAGFSYQHASGFFLNGNAAYSGSQFSDVENFEIEESDAFTLVNARAGYRGDQFELSVFANNLFDERFVTSQNTVSVNTDSGVVSATGNPRFTVNDPRLFGVELRVSY